MEAPVSAAPAKKASVFEDIVDIFFSPSEVFQRRRDGRFGIALLIYIVLGTLLFVLAANYLSTAFEADFERGMAAAREQNPNMTEEQAAMMRGFAEKAQLFGAPFVLGLTVLLVALAVWLVGKLFGSSQTLTLGMVVATYSQFPRLLQYVLNAVQAYLMDPASLTSMYRVTASPARFFDPSSTSPVLLAALSRLDLFTIWCTILIAIGLAITGNISRGKAFAAAAIVWLLGAIPVLSQAAR